jgi:hypothetical protein
LVSFSLLMITHNADFQARAKAKDSCSRDSGIG